MLSMKARSSFRGALIFGAIASALAGCSVTKEAREGANLLAAYTNHIKREAERLGQSRDALAKARAHNTNRLERSALETEQRNSPEVFLWEFEDDKETRLGLYNGVLAGTRRAHKNRQQMAQLREEHERRLAEAVTAADVRTKKLAATAQALAQLGKKPDFPRRLAFYVEFFKSVRGSMEQAKSAAENQSEKGIKKAKEKAKEISD